MLPQHGGVPNFSLRISAPILFLLALILITGLMLTFSFHLNADTGDLAAENRVKLSLIITVLLSVFVLLVGTGRWWHLHLWTKRSNRKRHHRNKNRR